MTGPQQPPPGGQWPGGGGGGEWQPPSEQTHYNVSPPASGQPYDPQAPVTGQPYDQAYGQPGYEQPQYDQYGNPVTGPPAYDQTQGYGQPGMDPYGQQPGYPPPGAPLTPTPKKGNATPWIIGGVAVGVVVLLICGIGAFFIFKGSSGTKSGSHSASGTSSAGSSDKGKYDGSKITNLCEKVDPSPLKTAVPVASQQKDSTHRESRDYGTSLSCGVGYQSPDSSSVVASSTANISASFSDSPSTAKTSFESSKKYASGQTGSGHTYGDIQGIGDAAFFYADVTSYVSYNMTVVSSNLVLNISIFMDQIGQSSGQPTADSGKQAASAILKDLLTKLG